MIIKIKNFIQNAIKNGYDGSTCKGWDWLRENLKELDFIFKTEEYKKCNGMKYKCIQFLYNEEKDAISFLEKSVLETVWFLNNNRERNESQENYEKKMLSDGWIKLTEEVVKIADKEKKKILVNATISFDIMSKKIEKEYKPFITSNFIGLKDLRARSRGFYLTQYENAFCKIIN